MRERERESGVGWGGYSGLASLVIHHVRHDNNEGLAKRNILSASIGMACDHLRTVTKANDGIGTRRVAALQIVGVQKHLRLD